MSSTDIRRYWSPCLEGQGSCPVRSAAAVAEAGTSLKKTMLLSFVVLVSAAVSVVVSATSADVSVWEQSSYQAGTLAGFCCRWTRW